MKRLLFICGFPGGGTDLTKTILNAHPQVFLNGEMPLLRNLASYGYDSQTKFRSVAEVEDFKEVLRKINTWNNIKNLDHDFRSDFQSKSELTLEETLRICFSAKQSMIWGNKTPQNTENIGVLQQLFPNAYFLIVVRDVRDVCLSWRNKWGKDANTVAAKWSRRMKDGWHTTRDMNEGQFMFLKFEDLLSETERCCRDLCSFLDIPFSERMLEHNKYTQEKLDGKINYGRAILPDNKDKWRRALSPGTIRRIEEIAFDTMKTFDYDIAYAVQPRGLTEMEKAKGFLHDAWAIIFVGNRSSQDNSLNHRINEFAWEIRKRL